MPVDNDLVGRVEGLLGGLGWSGLVELQFLTGRNGIPHLIDLNGRFYGSMALAEAARPGLPDAWGRIVLGQPLPPLPDGRPGVRFAWPPGDVRRALRERRGGLVADLAGTAVWATRSRASIWDVRDVGPAWYLSSSRWRRRLRWSRAAPQVPALSRPTN